MPDQPRVTPWIESEPPTELALLRRYEAEGLHPYAWSNDPGDVYAAHTHADHKVLYCLRGSITLTLPDTGQQITLNPGDRLDLPPGVLHAATVGPRGVVCLEAYRRG